MTDTQQRDVEVGGGTRQTRITNDTVNDEFVKRLAADYLWKCSEKSNFSDNLSVEHGADTPLPNPSPPTFS